MSSAITLLVLFVVVSWLIIEEPFGDKASLSAILFDMLILILLVVLILKE